MFSTMSFLVVATAACVAGPLSFTNDPVNAWRYSFVDVDPGHDSTYVPTLGDATGAVFQGFIADDVYWGYASPFDLSSSFHVFETYLLSNIDLIIPVRLTGDDGHTLVIDGHVVGGGGFDQHIFHDLELLADVPTRIQIIGYEAGGGWVFHFNPKRRAYAMSEVANLQMNAMGEFIVVPETDTTTLGVCAASLILAMTVYRRKLTAWGD